VQQFDDSRSQGLGTVTTDPEQAQQNAAALGAAAEAAGATTSAEPRSVPADAALTADTAPAATTQTTQTITAQAAEAATAPLQAPPPASLNGADTSDDDDMTMAALLDNPSNAMHELQRGDVIEGTIARVDSDEVLVDIGQKSEGVISNREMGSVGETGHLQVGQKLLVYVVQPESAEGHATLSLKRARMEQSWRDAEQWMNEDRVIEAPVIDFNKGGLIVEVGVRGFVPISQISELRGLAKGPDSGDSPIVAERLAGMRGRVLKLKIIELNRARNRLILSERLAMQEERAGRKEALLHELEPGQIRAGRVTSLAAFGAFVDLGGADGLVHISQISYSRVSHPSEALSVGDEVKVYVLSIDPQTKKIALSLKKAQPDPWTLVEEHYKVGDVVEGTITKLAKFGAFARINDGIEGLIHLSELADGPVEKPQDVVHEGQDVKLRVIAINSQRRRLGLSLRQAQGDTLRPVEVPAEFDDDLDGDYEPSRGGAPSRPQNRPPAQPAAAVAAPDVSSTAASVAAEVTDIEQVVPTATPDTDTLNTTNSAAPDVSAAPDLNNMKGHESSTTSPQALDQALGSVPGGAPPGTLPEQAATAAPALETAPVTGEAEVTTPTNSFTPTAQGTAGQETAVPDLAMDNRPEGHVSGE